MQTERTFLDDLKHQYQHGGMTIRLIMFNTAIFLAIQVVLVFARLIGGEPEVIMNSLIRSIFALQTELGIFILKPWGLLTSIFAHFSLLHFLFNMLFLYFSGRMFEQLFDHKRLLYTYLLGGIAGGLLEIIAHAVFPALQGESQVIIGASGSIMAVFAALAFYRPNLTVSLFGILPVRLIILAGIFILSDLLSLGAKDGTAHFAHIGGVIIGMISIRGLHRSSNLITLTQKWIERGMSGIKGLFSRKPRMKVTKGGQKPFKSDEDYIYEKRKKQEKTDLILDKISKSGYESLTKAEKDFLFQQSNK